MSEQPLSSAQASHGGEDRPVFPDGYVEWLWDELDVSIGPETEATYDEFARALELQFGGSPFFVELPNRLHTLHADYKVQQGDALLAAPAAPVDLDVKTWSSFFEKTYRRNVLDNPRWPEAPDRGWLLPDGWVRQIGDIVRTIVIVRYLDGMDRVAAMIADLAGESGLAAKTGRIAKVEGYYATHVDVGFAVRVPVRLDVETVDAFVEIQITTELQANIRSLAHGHYEKRRMANVDPSDWQWNFQSPEFSSNYLGHVLHYLEGMIMQLREGRDERPTD